MVPTIPLSGKEHGLIRGTWVVVALLGIGLLAASAAWYSRYFQTHRSLGYWGSPAVLLIRAGQPVELWQLERLPTEPQGDGPLKNGEILECNGRRYRITARKDVTRAPGLLHLRAMLLSDDSFTWQRQFDAVEHDSRKLVVLVFHQDARQLKVWLDPQTARIGSPPDRPWLDASPKSAFWKRWLSEQIDTTGD